MAIRVRKLAKELNRSTLDLLGMLHAIGYVRYRSPEDMVSDSAIERLRRAMRDGVEPVPVEAVAVPRPASSPAPRPPRREDSDLMSLLVPGVVRRGVKKEDGPVAREAPVQQPPDQSEALDDEQDVSAPAPDEGSERSLDHERRRLLAEQERVEADRDQLEADRHNLDVVRERLEAERQRLAAEQERLAAVQERLAAEQERLAAEQERLAQRELNLVRATQVPEPVEPGVPATRLADVLADRGLKGVDEAERALAALAGARQLRDLIGVLAVDDLEAVSRLLGERLVLVGGEVPEFLPPGMVGVTVSPDRAELPGGAVLQRELFRVGEVLMLHGLRRVLVVGGRPAWQRVLREGVDSRIEVRFVPGRPRGRAEAEVDVTRTDAVVLWGVEADAEARGVYGTSRAVLVEVPASDLPALLRAVRAILDTD